MLVLLVILTCAHGKYRSDLASYTQKLMDLLQTPKPPIGEPWPKIPGPGKQDQVCIVGAGPAGIHMALGLKRRNYTNVVVLEKSNRVGGKSFDINYDGVYNPLGSTVITPNHFNNIVPLAQQYGLEDVIELPDPQVWITNSASQPGSNMSFAAFQLGLLSEFTNSSSHQLNLAAFLEASVRYVRLHKAMFGDYEGDLMLQPSPRVLHRVRGTFLQFLKRENMMAMVPNFLDTVTLDGNGHLDEISALYGLMYNDVNMVIAMALRAVKQGRDLFSFYVLKSGYEKIWKTIVEKEVLNVEYNVDIVGVKRSNNGVLLHQWNSHDSTIKTKTCRFIVWTPAMSDLLRVLHFPTREEKRLFSSLKPEVMSTTLLNIVKPVRNGAVTVYTANLLGDEDNRVVVDLDMTGLLTPGIATPEGLELYNEGKEAVTLVCCQQSKNMTSELELNRRLRDHYIQGFNATQLEILSTKSFSYFPRWSPEEMSRIPHWKVFGMQGQGRIWYAGSSVSFESVHSVLEYNNLLLRQMV